MATSALVISHATRDSDLRHTQTGKAFSSLRLATNRSVKGEEETQFHTIVCWDCLVETTAEFVKKGDPLPSRAGCSTASSLGARTGTRGELEV
jgi:single-stranded DNA-binding protein